MGFEVVEKFEKTIANFFGAPYGVAVDSCTHGIELCLRYLDEKKIIVPVRTYISIPFLSNKLNIDLEWSKDVWKEKYNLTNSIIDAAVLWRKNSYIPGKFMSLSFQFQKHLSLGRGGMILCPSKEDYFQLKKMSYDGRLPNVPWRNQNIDSLGYHYYMTPETAKSGLEKFEIIKNIKPKEWHYEDWPDISKMTIFQKNNNN